jgi:transcriptional regulator with XRE-family HTH domain
METFGQALRRLRVHAGLSQPALARRAFVSQTSISRYEHDQQTVDEQTAARLDEALHADGKLRALFSGRDGIRIVPTIGNSQVSSRDVAVIVSARGRYEQMYRAAGGAPTGARVETFLAEYVKPRLQGVYADEIGQRLLRATGGLVAVAGICASDSNSQHLASRYYRDALDLARASGDRAFGGYVMALMVNQALFLTDYRNAAELAEAGVRDVGRAISPALATDLHVMQAKAYAAMEDAARAHTAMVEAEQAAGAIRHDEEPPETSYVQPGLVETQLAETLISLRDYTPARDYAEEATRLQAHARGQVHRLATLTQVDLGRGDVEQAAANALHALDLAEGMESQRIRGRFVTLRRQLEASRSELARSSVERIDAALSVPL